MVKNLVRKIAPAKPCTQAPAPTKPRTRATAAEEEAKDIALGWFPLAKETGKFYQKNKQNSETCR